MLKNLQAGKTTRFGAFMETVANAYGIPSIDLGVEIARREKAGTLIFKAAGPVPGKLVFSADGTHPGDAGHDIYRDVIARSMLAIRPVGRAAPHRLPAPLEPNCWETAGLLAVAKATLSPGWTAVDVGQDPVYRNDFGRTHAMLRGAVKCDAGRRNRHRAMERHDPRLQRHPPGQRDASRGVGRRRGSPGHPAAADRASHTYARFFYLPARAPGRHTAVLRVTRLPEGLAYYAGQVLVVGQP